MRACEAVPVVVVCLAAMVQGELWEEAVEEVMKWGSSGSVK